MKRIIAYIVLIFFFGIYFISTVNPLMKKIAPVRYDWQGIFGTDNYSHGDLYGFTFLPEYKIDEPKVTLPVLHSESRKIDLYCVCDSYIWFFNLKDSNFYGVNKYYQNRWAYDDKIDQDIDTSKTNFLLLEMSERNVRNFLSDSTDIYSRLVVHNNTANSTMDDSVNIISIEPKNKFYQRLGKLFSNDWINKNLGFNLLDYKFTTPFRELKAEINYKLFNRINPDAVFSADKEYLFYNITIDTNWYQSSFKYLSPEEESKLVRKLNEIKKYYSKRGFKYIYFTIIPNPVSILEPGIMNYNNLTSRIQNNPELKMPFIDAQSILKKEPESVYKRSDSHWNYHGFDLWLHEVNSVLKEISK